MTAHWRGLSRHQRRTLAVLVPIEFALTGVAAVDLWKRPSANIRGSKAVWWPMLLAQPFGPIAYLAFGRRRIRILRGATLSAIWD